MNYGTKTLEDLIISHPDWNWNMGYLSKNPSITPEIINRYPKGITERKWNTRLLSLKSIYHSRIYRK
jgi:hypothetical protein